MAILKRKNGTYQARYLDPDRKVHSKVFATKREATEQEIKWRQQKMRGYLGSVTGSSMTVDQYFVQWHKEVEDQTRIAHRSGWQKTQAQLYRDYIGPLMGRYRLKELTPQMVKRVLTSMAVAGLSEQTQVHAFSVMRKMFTDAIENYQYISSNPARRKLKPQLSLKEAKHLNLDQMRKLLNHVENKKYGLAIWLQLFMGLRVGELQALKWEDIDLETGRLTIRRAYVRKMAMLRDYPKGKRQHSIGLPFELWQKLREARVTSTSEFVVTSRLGKMVPYRWFLRQLGMYCGELKIPIIGTHGLRHSTSELYLSHGASRDDLRQLFAHSSTKVTDRYVHDRGTNLEKVTNVISLFGEKVTTEVTTPSKTVASENEVGLGVTTKVTTAPVLEGRVENSTL